jgi:uncharacterized protein (DUF2336 family)
VSSSDFLQIASRTGKGKAERLFRAAISAFSALTRPSKREMARLEDLLLPLFGAVSPDAMRFAAAVLSEMPHAPPALVRRLCEEAVDVAAPLLVRSPKLTDIDLLALVSRHGLPHARAIARRGDLNPTIAALIATLERRADHAVTGDAAMPEASPVDAAEKEATCAMPETAAENVRRRLRSMMLPAESTSQRASKLLPFDHVPRAAVFARLRATAFSGNHAYFQTALADALGIDFKRARPIVETGNYTELVYALKALDLDAEEAFLITAAVFPKMFGHTECVRLFVERYQLCHTEAARDRLRGWKAEAVATAIKALPTRASEETNANRPVRVTALKAS